jgi:hypothetical protein
MTELASMSATRTEDSIEAHKQSTRQNTSSAATKTVPIFEYTCRPDASNQPSIDIASRPPSDQSAYNSPRLVLPPNDCSLVSQDRIEDVRKFHLQVDSTRSVGEDSIYPSIHSNSSEQQSPGEQIQPQWLTRGHKLKGWRGAILAGTIILFLVFISSFTMLLIFAATHSQGGFNERLMLYQGSCDITKSWSLLSHTVINILQVIIFAPSFFGMLCLCAPTLEEVEMARRRGYSLKVGIINMKNFFWIKRIRGILFLILLISTTWLHLTYVFSHSINIDG